MAPSTTRVRFPGAEGHQLAGRLYRPTGPIEGVALFAHCFTCSKDLHASRNIAAALAHRGFAVLSFDFTGLGQSEGDFAETSFASNVDDLVAAAAFLEDEVGAPSLLVGHSLGGAAVYRAAERIESCRAVASIAAPSDPAHVTEHLGDDVEAIERDGEATVQLAGRPFRIKRAFLRDVEAQPLQSCLRDLGRAVLILHSPQDETVGIEHARKLYEAAWHPKSFISLDGADHLLSDPADAAYAGEVIASWARRYASHSEPRVEAEHDHDVEAYVQESFTTQIIARDKHRLQADEPTSMGGRDLGPSPFELVSAGLGACTAITLRMYADRKEWPLEAVRVHVTHDKVDQDQGPAVDRFTRAVELVGPELDQDQRDRLLGIANRCPVHRMLERSATIETSLV